MVSGFQVFIDTIFNPVFGWMLKLPPILAIIILALILATISTLLQKFLTDQAKMKRLREDTKKLQEQMKKVPRDKPDQLIKLQQKVMPIQMDLMKESFKPLLVTLIPFLLVFFWLANHFAYHQIQPNTPFTVSATFEEGLAGTATLSSPDLKIEKPEQTITQSDGEGVVRWIVQGPAGEHNLTLSLGPINVTRQVLVSEDRIYETPQMPRKGTITSFNVENEKLIPIPGFSLFGWHPGWIFYYILFSIPLSLILKKLLDVV